MDTVFIGDGFYHEIRGVSDIAVCAHKYCAAGNRLQKPRRNETEGRVYALRGAERSGSCQKHEVGRCVVKKAGQSARRPEQLEGLRDSELRTELLQDHERRLHGDKDADEQLRDLLDCAPGKVICLSDFLRCCAE